MILASAIKYRLIHINTNCEIVLCGSRHGDIYDQMEKLGLKEYVDYIEIEQGFIDHNNNFLTREKAYQHAKECGQLSSKLIYEYENSEKFNHPYLISEDLW